MTLEELKSLVDENSDLFDQRWRGIEFCLGWGELFAEMLESCRLAQAPTIMVSKEKMGSLRVYFSNQSHPAGRKIRAEMMDKSENICEVCGAKGQPLILRSGLCGTRCPEHKDVL